MNFGQLIAAALDDLNLSPVGQVPGVVLDRVKRWMNEGHFELLSDPVMSDLRKRAYTFQSESGQPYYGLPQAYERLIDIVQTDNDLRLRLMTQDGVKRIDPGNRSVGTPQYWIPFGYVPFIRQPRMTGVWAASTSALDVTQQVVYQFVTANGDQQSHGAQTLTGLARVALGASTDVTAIIGWSLTSSCAGAVTLYDAAVGGTVLARIPVGETAVQYQAIRLWPTPGAVMTYECTGDLLIPTLSDASDLPMLPASYHAMLVTYVRFRQYKKDGDNDRMNAEVAMWLADKDKLMSYVQYPPDHRPIAGRFADGSGWSDLGGDYPADRWLA